MRVYLEYLRDHLTIPPVALYSRHSMKDSPVWFQVIRYEEDIEFEPQFMLFGRGDRWKESLSGKGLISIGHPGDAICKHNDVLILPEDCDEQKAFRQIQQLILQLNMWETDLRHILSSENHNPQRSTLDALFSRASDLLTNSIFFHDENFYLMGNSQSDGALGLTQWNYDEVKGGYIVPLDILNDFKTNQEYQDTMHTHGPCLFSADTFGYRIMYQNIWEGDQYQGRICINELDREFYESDSILLEYLAEMIYASFRQRNQGRSRQMYSMAHLLLRMVQQEALGEKEVYDILTQYGWERNDQFFCAYLIPEERDINTNTLQYYCSLMTGRFLSSCAFCYHSGIIIFVNQSRSKITVPDFHHAISPFLRDSLLKAGISAAADDFMDFYLLYRQAVCAYETGRKTRNDLWCFCFEDFRVEYILGQIVQEFPLRHICSPDLYQLITYDKTHTSDLYHTFRAYLYNDRNLARTAEILGIHRTTLLFRMKKIGELLKADYTDPYDRFYLYLSYRLMDELQ